MIFGTSFVPNQWRKYFVRLNSVPLRETTGYVRRNSDAPFGALRFAPNFGTLA